MKSRELITRPVVQDSFLHLLHHRLHDLEILATAGSLAFSISNCKAAFQPPVQCSAANATRNRVFPARTMNSFSILMEINSLRPLKVINLIESLSLVLLSKNLIWFSLPANFCPKHPQSQLVLEAN